MGFKMAPSESAKVALGVVALAGIGLVIYIISKQLRKKNKANESSRIPKEETQPLKASKETSDEESLPDLITPEQVETEPEPAKAETDTSSSQTSTAKNQDDSSDKITSESASFVSTETASISASMAGWEDVKSLDSSFLEVKSPPQTSGAEAAEFSSEMVTSQMGPDSMESFTELSHKESWDNQGGKGDSASEKPGHSNVPASGTGEGGLQGSEGDVTLPPQKEKASADDVQSLQSEDTSSGEAPSFEQINGSDDATSLGDNNADGGEHLPDLSFGLQQQADSLQSFEKVSMGSSGLKTSTVGDAFRSFEQIKEESGAGSMKSTDSSIVVIPDSLDGSLQGQQTTQGEKEKDSASTKPAEQPEKEPVSEDIKTQSAQKTESKPKEAEKPSESGPEQTQKDSPQKGSASEGEGNGSLPSFEVIQQKGLGDAEQFYSSESLQSFATAISGSGSGSGSGSSKQDFYSPISSPPMFDSSFDDTSFKSFDDTANTDTEVSEELTFYDVEASGRQSPLSPQDRTPTNTPIPQEMGGGDAQNVKTPVGETSTEMEESLIMDEKAKSKEEKEVKSDSKTDSTKSAEEKELKPDSVKKDSEAQEVASATAKPEGKEEGEEPATSPLLSIDRDKMTEAILQAQDRPEKLEIGHVQILVELLKREDMTLLNTTLQCLMRATAFTINVEVLRVVGGPQELSRLLQKFAGKLGRGGESKCGGQGVIEGAPGAETLFLNCARVVNNVAMDIKSQPQLEDSIPALTDLLMTEGISETVTLACLQPLTNLSTSKTYHGHYTLLLQQLYSFLDTSHSAPLRLQCLKLLVNLSLNADMVPHMLAAKAPSCLLDLLDVNYDMELLLRTVTFLANVMTIMQERGLSPANLPTDEKAPSPETLLSALVAHDRRDALRNKVYRLTRHDSPDVCYQASRLYGFVAGAK